MARENFNDLVAFVTVARDGSFTKAAARLGVSQSALSHTIRALETRLGVRLLTRTTRSVSRTEAGERLYATVAPRLEEIESEVSALVDQRDRPAATIRISAAGHALNYVLWPKLQTFLPAYPDIKLEIIINYGFIDIVAERFDAGVRLGDEVAKDMIAVRIAPDMRMAVVGAPSYFAGHAIPATPQDLAQHKCIAMRLQTHGGLYAWEFKKDGHAVNVRVEGQLIFNTSPPMVEAVFGGFGLAYVPEDMVAEHIASGRLIRVLQEWCPHFPGYHLYFASRRQASPAFALLVEALRHPG